MSADYVARLIYGYEITEEQYNCLEENYDIVREESKDTECRIDAWMIGLCQCKYFFGVQTAHLDLNYDDYIEPITASVSHVIILERIAERLHLNLKSSQYPRLILINGISY